LVAQPYHAARSAGPGLFLRVGRPASLLRGFFCFWRWQGPARAFSTSIAGLRGQITDHDRCFEHYIRVRDSLDFFRLYGSFDRLFFLTDRNECEFLYSPCCESCRLRMAGGPSIHNLPAFWPYPASSRTFALPFFFFFLALPFFRFFCRGGRFHVSGQSRSLFSDPPAPGAPSSFCLTVFFNFGREDTPFSPLASLEAQQFPQLLFFSRPRGRHRWRSIRQFRPFSSLRPRRHGPVVRLEPSKGAGGSGSLPLSDDVPSFPLLRYRAPLPGVLVHGWLGPW